MEQYSAICPHCNFELQFYDASLFGRKGRCPKCRNKFVLNKQDEPAAKAAPIPVKPTEPKPKKDEVPAEAAKKEQPPVRAAAPAKLKPAARAVAAAAAAKPASEAEEAWEMEINRGMGLRRPTLPARWVLPNVLSVTNLLVIAIGASTGMGAVSLLVKDCPVYFLTIASTVGGLIATGFLIRTYDPQEK